MLQPIYLALRCRSSLQPAPPATIPARPQRYLTKHGFEGRVLPINPNRKTIFGAECYPDIGSAPGPVDHAFIMLPTNAVIEAVRQCGAAGVGCATVLAGGFADSGNAGRRRQDARSRHEPHEPHEPARDVRSPFAPLLLHRVSP